MQQWISKLRTQRARAQLRDAGKSAPLEEVRPWHLRLWDLSLGLLGWLAACIMLYAENPWPRDPASMVQYTGNALFLLLGIMICATFLRIVNAQILQGQSKHILLLVLLSIFTLIPVRLLFYAADTGLLARSTAQFLLPLAFGPMLATILVNSGAGAVLGLWTAFAAAIFAGHSFTVLTTGLITTGVAVYAARDVHKRSQMFKAGLMIGVAQVYVVVAMAALNLTAPDIVLRQVIACLLNGMITTLSVLLVLPLFETVFDSTSDITLLELSDLSHPLLQRLALEAPGTYHHSLLVANLAQTAAAEIGANGLLVRIGAYFHDIGKLSKPELFIENNLATNIHDELAPSMSALLITAHVKEGIGLAMLGNLPRIIIDMIQQHHGTSLVAYFHHRAKMQLKQRNELEHKLPPTAVNEGDFRYAGPRPKSREAAIIMLADTVEAASHSLAKPTAGHLQTLVDEVVYNKIRDGQLDDCHMRIDDLAAIRESFIFTLTSMFHNRIPYPKNEYSADQPSTG